MSPWLVGALVLTVAGLGPALWLGMRGGVLERLVGLELATADTVLVLLLLVQNSGQSSLLIVPLTLVLASFAGTMVFARLLRERP